MTWREKNFNSRGAEEKGSNREGYREEERGQFPTYKRV
jgi:hypothetical protein